ncbi:MAG TPA: WGR domain-containing protein [Chloroflexia bacterium]|nr:WGR domain-containing protein [Chloroflexia bacterium]
MADSISIEAVTEEQEEPLERQMFQLTDFVGNHNKFYMVELWPAPDGMVRLKTSWGRVGSKPQVSEKVLHRHHVDRQIAEKMRKGYRRIDLHRPELVLEPAGEDQKPLPRRDPKVEQLVEWIYTEAGEHIRSFLAVEIEALSQAQIAEGRRLLRDAQGEYSSYRSAPLERSKKLLAATVQAYYNAIPTKLPARLDPEQVVIEFCKQFSEQEDRLLQLEAAIATIKVQRQHPGFDPYETLGAEIIPLSQDDHAHKSLSEYITGTQVHGYALRIKDIFEVRIAEERERYERNSRGISHRELLFHGTRNQNVRHILRQGLICPSTPAHGRMLGNGIYLANKSTKSSNYCLSSRPTVPCMLLIVEAALGNRYVAPEMALLNEPPIGYDSVWGKAGVTRITPLHALMNDEFVVYSPSQQTIRYLVTFEPGVS